MDHKRRRRQIQEENDQGGVWGFCYNYKQNDHGEHGSDEGDETDKDLVPLMFAFSVIQ